jgi:hypothetical protein
VAPIKAEQVCKQCGEPFYGLVRDHCTVRCRDAAKLAQALAEKGQPKVCGHCGELLASRARTFCSEKCRRAAAAKRKKERGQR